MLLQPDDVEWRARRAAGFVTGPRPARFRSEWPGLLLGWRRLAYARRLQIGDPIDLVCAAWTTVEGQSGVRPHQFRCSFAGFFATGHRTFDEATILLPIERLRTMLGHDQYRLDGAVDLVTDVAIRVRAGLTPAEVAAGKQRLAAAVQALLPAGSAPCTVLDWEEQNQVFLSAVAHEHGMMTFVLFVVMLIAAFVIYAVLHMMVTQKVKDIGILAAVGGTPRGIGAVFLFCGIVIGALGGALGTALGVLSVVYLNPVNRWFLEQTGLELFPSSLFDLPRIPCHLEPAWIAQVAIGALLLALLVAWLPARRAARMDPVQALSYE
jgi:lipoprotein-releasing system permease protein